MSHVLFLFGLTLISTLINGEISVHEPIEGVFNLLERVKSPQSSCQARIMTNNRDFQRFNRGTKPAQIGSCGYIDYPKNHCTLVTFIDCPNEFYPRFFARLSLGRRMWNDIYIVVNTNASLSIERVISPHIKNINDIVFMVCTVLINMITCNRVIYCTPQRDAMMIVLEFRTLYY